MLIRSGKRSKIQEALETPFDNASNDFDNDDTQKAVEEIDFRQLIKDPTGFPNRIDSSIDFDDSTRTFTITPTGDNFTYWIRGHPFTVNSADSVIINDTEGIWYIYYYQETLTASQTLWELDDPYAFISVIYWDSTNKKGIFFTEQRHPVSMSWSTRDRWHNTVGASKEIYSFDLINYILKGDGSLDAHAKVGLDNGILYDEDNVLDIVHNNTPTNPFEQYLDPHIKLPLYYRAGAFGVWRKVDATDFPVAYDGVNPIKYNKYDSGSWTLTNCDDKSYMNIWVFATPNINEPIIGVLGQLNSDSFTDVVGEELSTVVSKSSAVKDFTFLYKLVYKTDTSYTNTPKAVLYDFFNVPFITISVINTTVVGAIQKFSFGSDANAGDKWLSHEFENVSGFDVPAIVGYESELRSVYFNNKNSNIDVDIEVYKNGITAGDKVYTLEVRNSKWRVVSGLPVISFSPGDKIRVYIKKISGTANDVISQIELKIIDDTPVDLSGNT